MPQSPPGPAWSNGTHAHAYAYSNLPVPVPTKYDAGSGSAASQGTEAGGSRRSSSGTGGGGVDSGDAGRKQREAAEMEAKRRRVQRACDVCRRKKIKCEGPMNSKAAAKCAYCQEFGLECTYVEAAKPRGPPKGYLEALEQRCGRLEKVLQQLHPNIDIGLYAGPPLDREDFDAHTHQDTLRGLGIPPLPAVKALASSTSVSQRGSPADSSPGNAAAPSPSLVLGPSPWKAFEQDPNRPPASPTEEHDAHVQTQVAEAMQKLSMRDSPWRFHGKASGHYLMVTLQSLMKNGPGHQFVDRLKESQRPEYWKVPEWEIVVAQEKVRPVDMSVWPEDDVRDALIDAYFRYQNQVLPLLNRFEFRRLLDQEFYKTNHEFAKVCLLVFANGSRYLDDERVYWPRDLAASEEGKERLREDRDGTLRYSAGWRFFLEVVRMGKSLMSGPDLYEFQALALSCSFLIGSAVPHLTWLVVGIGLRAAQELGIHVRSILLHADPKQRALYNRAFWCLYHIDRLNCAAFGRSVAIQDTDFDADYPIAVDDEYWDTGDPERDFKQPPEAGLSSIAGFVQILKLDHIIGAALRTIYAVNKLPEQRGDMAAQRAIVIELDSALNTWADGVPDQLRWDPSRTNQDLFETSALLYTQYYYVQILVHRPFISISPQPSTDSAYSSGATPSSSSSSNNSGVDLPSLAICSNAARAIANIIDAVLRRGRQMGALPGRSLHINFMLPCCTAFVVLLIGIYAGRQQPDERDRAVGDIKRMIAAMKEMEVLWRQAGRLTDVLIGLTKEGEFPVPQAGGHGTKRGRGVTQDGGANANGGEPAASLPRPGMSLMPGERLTMGGPSGMDEKLGGSDLHGYSWIHGVSQMCGPPGIGDPSPASAAGPNPPVAYTSVPADGTDPGRRSSNSGPPTPPFYVGTNIKPWTDTEARRQPPQNSNPGPWSLPHTMPISNHDTTAAPPAISPWGGAAIGGEGLGTGSDAFDPGMFDGLLGGFGGVGGLAGLAFGDVDGQSMAWGGAGVPSAAPPGLSGWPGAGGTGGMFSPPLPQGSSGRPGTPGDVWAQLLREFGTGSPGGAGLSGAGGSQRGQGAPNGE